ncbi:MULTISPECIES: hypothetical protein [Streptomyces]|uniref:Secreted protein n=1 Tax=Streptomyces caniscabiei TaxID=2746961 RepID=A0ABU4MRM0_9ACTN|nr:MULTISPECIES: hypothetical protein [Streptomyces]MBE4734485.1 hypothetical protein [Streptomyces caniscabiei]MBE4755356.1 hypothetical protein [Streptomyces caniscabiei]MBE4772520.1 hypothetical protein [Streptomyces caniscabiei]MBE4783359.1 hypothetical protein [Streptomyces caniscabiei]MBE4792663.1 hypothetical protein [Streptomyces caniscabiei]
MKKLRTSRAVAASAVLISTSALLLVPASAASATEDDCDGIGVIGVFRAVESGASFDFRGRRVELQNESALDRYSRAEIKSGRKAGDRLWVDRSHRSFPDFKGTVTDQQAKRDGWKMCGPYTGSRTQSVYNANYAARACGEFDGITKCGKWWVD